jgi:hypothetical protein
MKDRTMAGFSNQQTAEAPRPASRIENDVEQVKVLSGRVDAITDRIIRHARALGYFEPTPDMKVAAPTEVITTLADALRELDRKIDRAGGSLNVFD